MDHKQLIDWSDSIIENVPDIRPEEIHAIVNGFMTGVYEYDNTRGIRNIFDAIKLYRNNNRPKSVFVLP